MTPQNVLFLCNGNAARSIIAESLLNHWGKGRFVAYSAGHFPDNAVHPLTLAVLNERLLPTENLRSKSWDEFAAPDAPLMHHIIALYDESGGEVCPEWPDHPNTLRWSLPDPANAVGTRVGRMIAFRNATRLLEARVREFLKPQ